MSVEIAAVAAGAAATVVRGNAHRLQHVASSCGGATAVRPDVTTPVGRL